MRVLKLLVFVVLVALSVSGYVLLAPMGPGTATFVEIPPGTGTGGIASALQSAGVIRSRWAFAALREMEGGTLKAGEYRFAQPASMLAVYDRLRRGDVFTVSVVIPEGYNLFEVAGAIEGAGLARREDFLRAAAANTALVRQWDPGALSLEGYLFPDTYRFGRRTTPTAMLGAMTRHFAQVAARLGLGGPSLRRTVIMASLVEREVHLDAERPIVAGVFENRLRLGMPLQTDPTVAYGSMLQGTWTGVIHRSELRSSSLYNTYTQPGLPPGPICNPGVAALRAALKPASTPYLYFVANPDGSTHFATSLRDHQANVSAYRRAEEHP